MAVTVYGTLLDVDADPLYAEVVAISSSGPTAMAGGILIASFTARVKTNPSTGYWSMTLEPGLYTISFGYNNSSSPSTINISVPSTGTYSVDQLLTGSVVYINSATGAYSIPNSSQGASLTGLALPFTPTKVLMTVQSPANGLVLYATLSGSPTSDGWTFTMNGLTDSGLYVLNWMAAP
jgi:hypothetical protein